MEAIRSYFDDVSPYSYLAWRALRRRDLAVRPTPIGFAALLGAGGPLGPAEVPAKRTFLIRDCLRRAPAWEQGRDLSDLSVLEDVLRPAGLPTDPAVKERLRRQTDEAIAPGVSFEVGGEIVWGSARFDDGIVIAEGRSALDDTLVASLAERPAGVVRKAARGTIDPAIAARVRQIFEKASFVRSLGIRVETIAPGVVTSALIATESHLQQDGLIHAGVITTLADHTAGAAAGTGAERPLTIELKINLLRPARGPELRCRATILRAGRTIAVVESEVFDGALLVAKATITLAVRSA